jgi:3-dehydroquinate synthase
VFVVSSPRIWRPWGRKLAAGLRAAGIRTETLLMDDREEVKRLATLERLAGKLLARGADRGALLVALGGGVVGDVTGFLAASYMRGVDYVQIPTTLVGQVDSALGGKTGVNLRRGKNLLGAFHQPLAVLADPRALSSLSARDFRAGLYEVVKAAVIGDPTLFRFLERRMKAVLAREEAALRTILARSIRLKARVVARDERERGPRQVLNFGHTCGHALETLTGYRRLRHGEAVAYGMLAATALATRLGRISAREAERIAAGVRAVGGLPALPRLSPERIYAQLQADKKRRGAEPVFILPRGVGRVEIARDVPRAALLAALRELRAAASAR